MRSTLKTNGCKGLYSIFGFDGSLSRYHMAKVKSTIPGKNAESPNAEQRSAHDRSSLVMK